jgi:high-affinity nickel-transport protein
MLTAIALGFALGLRHAADPDHVAAIAALLGRQDPAGSTGRGARAAAWIGVSWGLGHSLVILAVGGAFVALHISVVPGWALGAEAIVAVILVGLGVSNLRAWWHGNRDEVPQQRHDAATRSCSAVKLRSLGIGMAHGLAGSAAIALLALAAMPSASAALVYLLVFGLGTIGGMIAMSLGLGLPAALASGRPGLMPWVLGGSGAVSVAVGLLLLVEVGVATRLL